MKLEEIISSLRDQITDRESLIPKDEPDSIFAHDAEALREAIKTIETMKTERAAAVRDLEEIMFRGGLNIDTCRYCSTKDCYGRGGYRGCAPKWRGKDRQEEINHGKETEV